MLYFNLDIIIDVDIEYRRRRKNGADLIDFYCQHKYIYENVTCYPFAM